MTEELPPGWAQVTERSFSDGSVRLDAREDGFIEFGVEIAPDEWGMVPVPVAVVRAALEAGEPIESSGPTLKETLEAAGLMKHVEDTGLAYREGLAEGNRIRLEEHRRFGRRLLWFLGGFIIIYLLFAAVGTLIRWP